MLADQSTEDLIEYLNQTNSEEEVMSTREVIASAMTDIMSKVICGIQIHSIRRPNTEYVDMQNLGFAPSFRSQMRNFINFFSPYFAKKVNLFPTALYSYFNNLTWRTVQLRKAENIRRNDFLQIMEELFEQEMKLPEEDRKFYEPITFQNRILAVILRY